VRRLGIVRSLLFGHREEEARFFETAAKSLVSDELLLGAVELLQDSLGSVGTIPEVRLGGLFE